MKMKYLAGFLLLTMCFTMTPSVASADTWCRWCYLDTPWPFCYKTLSPGFNLCDDLDLGRCVLSGGLCGDWFADPGSVTATGSAAHAEGTETLTDGNLVIRSCDQVVVAQQLDGDGQRTARQAASRIMI